MLPVTVARLDGACNIVRAPLSVYVYVLVFSR